LGGLPLAVNRARALSDLEPREDTVLHIEIEQPRFKRIGRMLRPRSQVLDLWNLATQQLGPAARGFELLRSYPGRALAWLPWDID
ncbi:MAG: hypothetical protein QGG40_05915, partial [Myxococcota bacterium]|nr:hypothetical protein [Myxococcota bacterium]